MHLPCLATMMCEVHCGPLVCATILSTQIRLNMLYCYITVGRFALRFD